MLPLFMLIGAVTVAPPPPTPPPASAISAPASIGKPHVCDENQYPISALQTGTEGSTLMAFTITAQGGVADVSVQRSSGNPELDNASMACARGWQYRPAMQNGVPVETAWRAQVHWQIDTTAPFLAIDRAIYRCLMANETSRDEIGQATLHTVVRVHFSNGTIGSVAVVASSGIPDLDSQVAACYANMPPELATAIPGEMDELFVAMLPTFF